MTLRFLRRRYLVNYRLQLMIIGYGFIMSLAGIKLLEIIHQFYSGQDVFFLGFGPVSTVLVIATISIVFFLFVFAGFVISNHIAGPIYRLNLHMKMVTEGKKAGPMVIRKHDFFKELVATYNNLLNQKLNKEN